MYTHDEQIFDVFFSAILLGQISANKILFSDKKTALQKFLKKKNVFFDVGCFLFSLNQFYGSGLPILLRNKAPRYLFKSNTFEYDIVECQSNTSIASGLSKSLVRSRLLSGLVVAHSAFQNVHRHVCTRHRCTRSTMGRCWRLGSTSSST